MLTDADFEIARSIAEELIIPDRFGVDSETDEFNSDLVTQLKALNINNFEIDNGVSKAVIIFNDYNFVIKIPFNGCWYTEYDSENDEYGDPYFEYFCGAEAPDSTDYCWDECIRIENAEGAGFGNFFPETAMIYESNCQRFYIQEKVRPSRIFKPEPSENSKIRAQKIDSQYKYCSEDWRAMAIDLYGEGFLKEFINWCSDNEYDILSDLHRGNYGYSLSGAPVILDASGYRD